MDSYQTEDEQVEQLKRWFRENGRSLLTAVLVALLLVFGYRFWQDNRLRQREAAASEYQNLISAVRKWDAESKPEMLTTAKTLADTLKKDYSDSAYAQFGALLKARLAVKENDLTTAEAELRWVLDHKPDTDLMALTQVRLARVLHAKGDEAGALALIDGIKGDSYPFLFEKVRGDILLSKGDVDGARAAYQKAKDLEKQLAKPVNDPLLDIKLSDLQTQAEVAEKAAEKAAAKAAESSAESPATDAEKSAPATPIKES